MSSSQSFDKMVDAMYTDVVSNLLQTTPNEEDTVLIREAVLMGCKQAAKSIKTFPNKSHIHQLMNKIQSEIVTLGIPPLAQIALAAELKVYKQYVSM